MLLGSGGRASQVSGESTVFKRAARAEICPPVPVPPPLEKPILHHHRRHLEHTFFWRQKITKFHDFTCFLMMFNGFQ